MGNKIIKFDPSKKKEFPLKLKGISVDGCKHIDGVEIAIQAGTVKCQKCKSRYSH